MTTAGATSAIEGSEFYETPHIDRIGSRGHQVPAGLRDLPGLQSLSRASIMTGKFPARHGITDWIGAGEGQAWKRNTMLLPAHYIHALPAEDTTLAEAFREGGYRHFLCRQMAYGGRRILARGPRV